MMVNENSYAKALLNRVIDDLEKMSSDEFIKIHDSCEVGTIEIDPRSGKRETRVQEGNLEVTEIKKFDEEDMNE